MIGKLWMKSDEDFLQCAIDPAKRKSEIRKLVAHRNSAIACAGFLILLLFGCFFFGIDQKKDLISTHFLFILVMMLLQVTILYHLDSKIKILLVLDRGLMDGNAQAVKDGNTN